ncbi:MAG: alpha-amylase family glycosyl hydrolase [Paludibacter sp.]|nr:alpha-amylase family glycosyl hydrolase [Paludibacter sp.]
MKIKSLNNSFFVLVFFISFFSASLFAQSTAGPTYWWNDAVFYEVFVRSFYDQNGDGKGDFKGLTAKLDYLNDGNPATQTDLGITAIWLMPVTESPSYHGYDVTDYRTIESDYGTNADFAVFIEEAHKRGIKVIVDLVMNHSSNQHPWFIQSASSTTSPYRNWYRWNDTNPGGSWHSRNGSYYYGVFGSGMPDLNYTTPAMKTEMFDIARFWLQDMKVDGFRLDAVIYIIENATQTENTPETFQFWKDFRAFYKSVKPDAFAVGEAWTSTGTVKKYVENKGLDYCFEFDLSYTFVNAANSANASGLRSKIEEVMISYPFLQFGTFLTNHDQQRIMTTLGGDVSKAKLAAQLLLSFPGIPYLYYGEEIGTIGPKPDENIRTPMQWNGNANAGFTAGSPWRAPQADYKTKNIASQQQDTNSLWSTYNKMIQIRNNEIVLRRGNYASITSNASSAYVFLRQYEDQSIIVASNLSNTPISSLQITLSTSTLAVGDYLLTDLLTGITNSMNVSSNGAISGQNIGGLTPLSTALYKLAKFTTTTNLEIFPPGGFYEGGTDVTLTATGITEPISIYYTIDGTTPTLSSTTIASGGKVAITVDKTTLKAFAIDGEGVKSIITTNTYYTVPPIISTGGIKVRFQKPDEWTSVGFYAWSSALGSILGSWPGIAITADSDGWYSYTFDNSITSVNMVFNNETGNSQSVDVTEITANTCYKTNGLSGGKYLIVTTTCPAASVSTPIDHSLKIYPNPVIDKLILSSDEVITKVELITLYGSVIKTFNNETILSLNDIQSGIYLLKVNFANGKQQVERIVKL